MCVLEAVNRAIASSTPLFVLAVYVFMSVVLYFFVRGLGAQARSKEAGPRKASQTRFSSAPPLRLDSSVSGVSYSEHTLLRITLDTRGMTRGIYMWAGMPCFQQTKIRVCLNPYYLDALGGLNAHAVMCRYLQQLHGKSLACTSRNSFQRLFSFQVASKH